MSEQGGLIQRFLSVGDHEALGKEEERTSDLTGDDGVAKCSKLVNSRTVARLWQVCVQPDGKFISHSTKFSLSLSLCRRRYCRSEIGSNAENSEPSLHVVWSGREEWQSSWAAIESGTPAPFPL